MAISLDDHRHCGALAGVFRLRAYGRLFPFASTFPTSPVCSLAHCKVATVATVPTVKGSILVCAVVYIHYIRSHSCFAGKSNPVAHPHYTRSKQARGVFCRIMHAILDLGRDLWVEL